MTAFPAMDQHDQTARLRAGGLGRVITAELHAGPVVDQVILRKRLHAAIALQPATSPRTLGREDRLQHSAARSEERRVGHECVSPCRSRWWPEHIKKNN